MIAAIYARNSTEQTGVSEDQKSVTRQIEHARAYAMKKGWTVADEHIYCDDGISGAEFVKQPSFLRLMNALKPKPPFHLWDPVLQSHIGLLGLLQAATHRRRMDAQVRCDLGQPVAALSIRQINEPRRAIHHSYTLNGGSCWDNLPRGRRASGV